MLQDLGLTLSNRTAANLISGVRNDSNSEEIIGISELEEIQVECDRRRLLVLNVCDGATGAVLGGALGLGVAQMLAQPAQAVISHMWPVDQRIAPVFGALLARELARGEIFFESFGRTITQMNVDKEQLVESLGESPAEFSTLIERIENRDFDPKCMYYWGSPVFLE